MPSLLKPIPHKLNTPAHLTPFFHKTHKRGTEHQDGRVASPWPSGNSIPLRNVHLALASSASSSRPHPLLFPSDQTTDTTKAAMREPEPYDHLFKLLLIGDAGVGKSRYVEAWEREREMGWRTC